MSGTIGSLRDKSSGGLSNGIPLESFSTACLMSLMGTTGTTSLLSLATGRPWKGWGCWSKACVITINLLLQY